MVPRRQDVAEKVCLGDQLQTQREADNPHDSNAVQLLSSCCMTAKNLAMYRPGMRSGWPRFSTTIAPYGSR